MGNELRRILHAFSSGGQTFSQAETLIADLMAAAPGVNLEINTDGAAGPGLIGAPLPHLHRNWSRCTLRCLRRLPR